MSIQKLLESITPEAYRGMQFAVETGKWPNGLSLSAEQREQCLQLIIAYDLTHKDEQERVGYLPPKKPKLQDTDNQLQSLRILKSGSEIAPEG